MLVKSPMLTQSFLMDWQFDPLNYDFMRQALLAGVLIGILCRAVRTYLIVQRMALLEDVVAHAILPGLAIASFLNIPLLLGSICFRHCQYICHHLDSNPIQSEGRYQLRLLPSNSSSIVNDRAALDDGCRRRS